MMLSDETAYTCLFCLDTTARIKFDKKGRPYVICLSCHTRSFLRERSALLGMTVLPEFVATLAEQAERDPEVVAELQRRLDAFIENLHRKTASAPPTPAESSEVAAGGKVAERVA